MKREAACCLSRCRLVYLVCLVSDEIDGTDQETRQTNDGEIHG